MDATEWLAAYAQRLGVAPPSPQELDRLLALAGVAAHASERIAAPVACWLTARAALEPAAALAVAREVSAGATREVGDGATREVSDGATREVGDG